MCVCVCVCVCVCEIVTADSGTVISATASSSVCVTSCRLTYSDTCVLNLPHFLFARLRCPSHSFCNRLHNRHMIIMWRKSVVPKKKKKVLHIRVYVFTRLSPCVYRMVLSTGSHIKPPNSPRIDHIYSWCRSSDRGFFFNIARFLTISFISQGMTCER